MERSLDDNLVENNNSAVSSTHDSETEKAVLSLCLRSKEALNDVTISRIGPDDFADPRHQLIFTAITNLVIDSQEIDRFTVFEKLESMGKLVAAGGSEYIFQIANGVSVISSLPSYISIIKEKSAKRRLVSTFDEMKNKALRKDSSANDIVTMSVTRLSELRDSSEDQAFEPLSDILKQNINKIYAIAGGEREDTYKTYFRKLDAMTGGFRPGTLNIIAARPGMGKTALVINIATNVASFDRRPVNIFSLEMSKSEIGNRILATRSDYSAKQLQRASIKLNDTKKLADSYKALSQLPIYIDDTSDVNPVTMLSKCKELKSQGKLGLVIVDYLQLMSMPDLGKNSSRQNEISAISRSLKILAKEMNVPVIALSQLSRGSERRDDHTPMLSDLRDSGAIEQDADSVIFINRNSYYKKGEAAPEIDDADIIVAKNRHGEVGPVKVKWWGAKTLFFEEDRKSDPQDPTQSGVGPNDSSFTRVQTSGAAASDYNFDDVSNEAPPATEEPPFDTGDVPDPEPPPENEDNAAFFDGASDDLPEGFF